MKLRLLDAADAPRCAELEEILFPEDNPWPAHAFVSEIAAPHTLYLGAGDEAGLWAYAGMARLGPADDPEFEIHTIGVDPARQRQGLARMLMDELMSVADYHDGRVFLEVRVDNEPAIALYEAYDFTRQGIRHHYYQPSGADAYTMLRNSRSRRR
ncbi:ribosomal protein S18-alanine N-acetyltransferase [Corynebacterium testudinoris]|uniref:[Ribosomal protein bS18]-alanine N-acetyltransferase n=1 Tax=Corynebacterium testudinoris TaxID=136857 RepID=A0A0G3H5D1_9CORY|nr:ribosomal protein S18-alanine N-acetyltransferase [Corynebacterium testudinoris]AKK07940.1 ribosomal-protein-alanine acetyltransferase [Corynebacterium testudinoris]MBX8995561.1 ribosomal protein S18-alanine N-acetyltransferase [Corynebacterium testudinoris]